MVDKISGIIYKLNSCPPKQSPPKKRVLIAGLGNLPNFSPAIVTAQSAPEEKILPSNFATAVYDANSSGMRKSSDRAIVNWLISRNKGSGNLKKLSKTLLKGRPSALWKAQIAIILFSEIDTNSDLAKLLIDFLLKHCDKADKPSLKAMLESVSSLSMQNKNDLLSIIWKTLLQKKIGNPKSNNYDPIVAGNYYLAKYTVTKLDSDLALAQEHYQYVIDRPVFEVDSNNKLFMGIAVRYKPIYIGNTEFEIYDEVVRSGIIYQHRKNLSRGHTELEKRTLSDGSQGMIPRFQDMPAQLATLDSPEIEYYRYQARALLKLAQIELMRIKKPEDRQQRLTKACAHANQALEIIKNKKTSIGRSSIKFNDFTLLELVKTLAEINIQQAELAKENKDDSAYESFLTKATAQAKELEDWFKVYEGKCNKKTIESPWYKQIQTATKILKAKTLLYAGKVDEVNAMNFEQLLPLLKLDLVEKMALSYYENKNETLYKKNVKLLKQIINNPKSNARTIVKAKLLLGEIKGVKAGSNLALLQEAKALLELALDSKKLKDEELAKAHRILGENLTRQAFLTPEKAETLLSLAETAFTTALDLKISNYDKTAANIWLAKIDLFKAGRVKDSVTQRTFLVSARTYTDEALKIDGLDEKTVSEIFQLQGDIKVAWRDYDSAIALYTAAIEKDPNNQNAKVSLANVYAWQSQYAKALKIYREVVAHPNGNNKTAVYRARLGIADVYNWKEDYKTAINQYEGIITNLENETDQNTEIKQLKLQAKLGYYEAQLRNENYTELENAAEKAAEILENEPYGSPILLRAKFFMLEIADAYIATNKDDKALEILNSIKDDPETDPNTGKYDEVTLGMMARLRLARYYNSNDNYDKASEHFNDIYGLYIGGTGIIAFRSDNKALTNQELLMKTEALVFFKRYKEAAAIYEQVLQNPEISVRQRLDILCDYSSLFTFDDADKKDRIEDHDRAEEYFDTIILHYGNGLPSRPDLDNKERFLLAKALFNMAEIKRWGDNRDYALALHYYLKALKAIRAIDTDPPTRNVKELRARVNIGLAGLYQIKGDNVKAEEYAKKATKEKEELSKTYKKAAKAVRASTSRRILSYRAEITDASNNNREQRHIVQAEIPVHKNISVGVRENIDLDEKPEQTTSTYGIIEAHDVPIAEDTYLDIKVSGKILTTQNGKGRTELNRQPDLIVDAAIRNKYLTGQASAAYDFMHRQYNIRRSGLSSLFTRLYFNVSSVTNLVLLDGLSFGPEFNWYSFIVNGIHERKNISLFARLTLDPHRIRFLDFIPEGLLNVTVEGNYPYVEQVAMEDYTNKEQDSGSKAVFHPKRGRVKTELRVSLSPLGIPIDLIAEYQHLNQFSHVGPDNKERDFHMNQYMFMIDLKNPFTWPYNQ